ncbi:MAG: hypothetical protein ACK5XV_11310 [Flavobacteriales bacterium]
MDHYFVKQSLLILLGGFFFFFGCRREDTEPPVVAILSPASGGAWQYGELITVEYSAADDEGIEEVTVSITDLQGRMVVGPRRIAGNNRALVEGAATLFFDDLRVASGEYVLRVRASDGRNEGEDVAWAQLTGAPRTLERLLVLRQPQSWSVVADSLSGGIWLPAGSWSGQFSRAAVNSWDQKTHLFGRTQDGVLTLDGTSLALHHQHLIPFGLGDLLFEGICLDESRHEVWVACRDGRVRRIGAGGGVTSSFAAFWPMLVLASGNWIYVYGEGPDADRRLDVYVRSTGQLMQTLAMPSDVTDLIDLGSDSRILVVRQQPGVSSFIPFDRPANFLDGWTAFNALPAGTVTATCPAPGGLFAAVSGSIYRLSASGEVLTSAPSSLVPVDMKYQADDGSLWVLEEQALHRLSGSSLSPLSSFPTEGDNRQLLLLYNK